MAIDAIPVISEAEIVDLVGTSVCGFPLVVALTVAIATIDLQTHGFSRVWSKPASDGKGASTCDDDSAQKKGGEEAVEGDGGEDDGEEAGDEDDDEGSEEESDEEVPGQLSE